MLVPTARDCSMVVVALMVRRPVELTTLIALEAEIVELFIIKARLPGVYMPSVDVPTPPPLVEVTYLLFEGSSKFPFTWKLPVDVPLTNVILPASLTVKRFESSALFLTMKLKFPEAALGKMVKAESRVALAWVASSSHALYPESAKYIPYAVVASPKPIKSFTVPANVIPCDAALVNTLNAEPQMFIAPLKSVLVPTLSVRVLELKVNVSNPTPVFAVWKTTTCRAVPVAKFEPEPPEADIVIPAGEDVAIVIFVPAVIHTGLYVLDGFPTNI